MKTDAALRCSSGCYGTSVFITLTTYLIDRPILSEVETVTGGLPTSGSNCPGQNLRPPNRRGLLPGAVEQRKAAGNGEVPRTYPAPQGVEASSAFCLRPEGYLKFLLKERDGPSLPLPTHSLYAPSLELVVIRQPEIPPEGLPPYASFAADLAVTLTRFDNTVFLENRTECELLSNFFISGPDFIFAH